MITVGSKVSIIGLGRLGFPIAASVAARGVHVVGVDTDPAKVRALAAFEAPFREPGLEERLTASRGRLTATGSVADAVAQSDLTMIVVPTPSEEGGGFSLRQVLAVCELVGVALGSKDSYHLVSITSTVMPGSTEGPLRRQLEAASGKRAGEEFGLCYSPEFIALGSVIHDFLNPDFLLIGESDVRAGDVLAAFYARVCENDAPVVRLGFVNAELAKLSVNSFLTTKISFANMLARICEALPGADVDAVTDAVGLDTRIGPKYLKGAIGYGGPCFPRDNAALASLARELGAPSDLAEAVDRFNRAERARLLELVLASNLPGGTVAVLGLAYKPYTDVVIEAPGLQLVGDLAAAGTDVIAFDPLAMENAAAALAGSGARFASSLSECVAAAKVIVLATPWPEFRLLGSALAGGEPCVVIDCWRLLEQLLPDGCEYVPLGRAGDAGGAQPSGSADLPAEGAAGSLVRALS